MPPEKNVNKDRLDGIVEDARKHRDQRERSYREQALKLFPWICGRCAREFNRGNLQELTVHHRDHNHDNNPADGSNWELLCIYCHENEHSRYLDQVVNVAAENSRKTAASHKPFADLDKLLRKKPEN